ncbi:hypothetical protein ACX1QV_001246 [Campylobacter upsaliensis]
MAKSKRGFSFELRNSRQNRAFCVSKRVGKPLGFLLQTRCVFVPRGANATP